MPPSTLGPQVSVVACTSAGGAGASRSVAFITRAIRGTYLPLMWVSMAVRAPARRMQGRGNRALWKPTRPSPAASRISRTPCATDVGRRTRGTGAVTLAMTLAKQASLEREAGEGVQQGLALAAEGNPREPRALKRGLVLGGGSHRIRSATPTRGGEASQQNRILDIVEAAVHGWASDRPLPVTRQLYYATCSQILYTTFQAPAKRH